MDSDVCLLVKDVAVMINRGTRGQPYSGDRGEIL
jgi:hypothetical protein